MNAEVLIKFRGDTSNADSATKKMETSVGKLAKAFSIGQLAAQGISKAISIFNSGLDGAISRVDTLNNFPKVMSNLGISADESSAVINDLSEKLKGLPTSLDAGAAAVQRFTSKNGDVKKSEDIFLAVNNAILAGGASAGIQSAALEQISQAYAKGKPDMMEWRSLMTAMPAQLKQVATAMGYTDAALLGEAVRAKGGEKEFARMMETMQKMNKEGVSGFKSFDEQARNATGGISTSVANMKTAFTRGIGNIISSVNGALTPFGGLSGVIGMVGKAGEQFFSTFGQGIAQIIPLLAPLFQTLMPAFSNLLSQIMPPLNNLIMTLAPILVNLLNTLLPPLMQIIGAILPPIINLITPIIGLLQPILDILSPLIESIMTVLDPLMELINMILPPIIDLINTISQTVLPPFKVAFEVAGKVITSVFKGALQGLKPIFENIKNIFKGITDFVSGIFTGNWKKAWEGVKSIFSNIISGIGNIFKAPINFIIGGINGFIRGLNKIQIPDWVPVVGGMGFHISELPQLKVGTNFVPEDTLAMLHQGEAVIPKKFNPYANGINAKTIGTMQSNSMNPTINVYADFKTDPLGQVVSNIKTFSGGAKNDYNYGQGV